jgi:FkbM family methyltransferase
MENNKITKEKLLGLLNPHLQNIYNFDKEYYEVREFKTEELFYNTNRFDLISKYIFVDYYLNKKSSWGEKVYKEFIRIFTNGTFKEGDGLKNNYDDYKSMFINIIQNYHSHQIHQKLIFLPVDFNSYTIIDGAHRLATAFFFNHYLIEAVNLPRTSVYDYKYFINRNINEEIADFTVFQYSKLNKKVRIVNLFPIARGRDNKVEELLVQYGKIYYVKKLKLSVKNAFYLTQIMYKGESWIGNAENNYKGALTRAKRCFSPNELLRVFVFIPNSDEQLRELKEKIRKIYNIGNEAVHINDTFDETLDLIEFYFNPNTLKFYDKRINVNFENLDQQLFSLAQYIDKNDLDKERFCIDAGAVLAAFGLRENNDLDFFTDYKKLKNLPDSLSIHNDYLKYIGIPLEEILYNPENYFYYKGHKFLKIELVKKLKRNRGEQKDKNDINLINSLNNSKIKNKLLYYRYNMHKIINPNSFFWKALKRIRKKLEREYYSQNGQDKFLDQYVFKGKRKGYFIDIGAHNGIKYSNTLFFEKNRKWKGICVEPIPEVYEQLKKNRKCTTINAVISDKKAIVTFLKISGYSEMLSGIKEFYNQEHLQRIDRELSQFGGKKEEILIDSLTFNNLVSLAQTNMICYCSIDVEGAELEILKNIDFEKATINVFSIENNYNDKNIRDLMQKNGYIFLKKIGDDDIYIKKEFYEQNLSNFGSSSNI